MNHCDTVWLQTELSKLISNLLEKDVVLSAEEALQMATQIQQSKARALIESMFEVN